MNFMAVFVINSLLAATNAMPIKCIHKRHTPSCTHIVAYLGSSVTLNCSSILDPRLNGSSFSQITWYKFGRPLSEVTFRPIDAVLKNGSRILWLSELLHADAGIYVCAMGTDEKRQEKAFSLSIRESKARFPPFIINKKYKHISIKKGQNVVLKCLARSGIIPYFQWFYKRKANSTHYMSNLEENILRKPRLVSAVPESLQLNGTTLHQDSIWIYNASYKDSGLYICLVFTKHGKDYHGIRLSVIPEPLESSTELEVQHVSKPIDNTNSINSKIPMIILIALPAGLFILSCTAVIRSLEKSRQRRLAQKNETNAPRGAQDEDNNQCSTIAIHANYDYCNHTGIRITENQMDHLNEYATSEIDSTISQSENEAGGSSCSPLDILSNMSRQSSCHLTSTEAPITSSPPPELSSSSAGLDLEWEGLDLILPDGSELVEMSKEVDV